MKLIKEDDKLFHFKTSDGEFKVVKKGLSKDTLNKINKIKEQSMCEGGNVQKFEGGGDVKDEAQYDAPLQGDDPTDTNTIDVPSVTPDRAPASVPQDDSSSNPVGNFIGKYLVAPTVQSVKDVAGGVGKAVDSVGNFGSSIAKGAGLSDDKPAEQAPSDTSEKPPSADDNLKAIQQQLQPQQAQQGQAQPQPPSMAGALDSTMNSYMASNNANARVQAASAKANADQMGAFLKDAQAYQATRQAAQQQLETENAQLAKDVANGHVDPNHFMNNMTERSKVSTAIGILFSGIGAGAHGTNLALGVLKDQIDKDIEAQKANLGNKQNLLTQNMHRLGDMQAATAATVAQKYAMLQGQIQQQAYQDGSQTALNTANMANQMLQMKMIPLHQQIAQYDAQRKMMMNPNVDPQTKILMDPRLNESQKGVAMKALMEARTNAVLNQKSSDLYDQAESDSANPFRMIHPSVAQQALEKNNMALVHKTMGIKSPESMKEVASVYNPTFLGHLTGANKIRKMEMKNQFSSGVQNPYLQYEGISGQAPISPSSFEGEE
jgi:hypothetical protein